LFQQLQDDQNEIFSKLSSTWNFLRINIAFTEDKFDKQNISYLLL